MRDKDGLEEQLWQTQAPGAPRSGDPLAELARIVGQGYPVPPTSTSNATHPRSMHPVGSAAREQDDWVNQIERAFAHAAPRHDQPAASQDEGQAAPGMPAWLRSPAMVPQLPVPEGQPDPRLNPDAFAQTFHHEVASVSNAYYADDAYQLAAGNNDTGLPGQQWDGAWDNAPVNNQLADQQYDESGYSSYGTYNTDFAEGEYGDDAYLAPAPTRRRGLMYAAIAIGIGAIAVAGSFAFRTNGVISGEAPIIAADSQPVRVEPETPGGEEVPNTNKAIYEHTNQVPTGEGAVVVDNREQPVDVSQMLVQQGAAAETEAAAIAQQAEGVTTTTTNTTTTGSAANVTLPEAPEPTSPAIVSLGEPKRVRTVSVRPDGSIVPSNGPNAPAQPVAPSIDQLASATPAVPSPTTPSVASPVAPIQAEAAVSEGAVAPAAGPVPRPSSANRPATRAPLQLGPMQISPQASATQSAQAPAPAATPVTAGSYTVQLAAPGSENEARNLFSTLQRKHSELSGFSPNVVRAETGGRTIYRLRVGSFPSRDAATALCVRIQATGGQCFVARN
ncbi:SPOR domain-containing protein [Pseudochelatococcus sp. G4_1912]|uniref:SPOR domain-containing protein n=1 Tax=Pseudochelatococcus sp. G4_1912 TaxID=3114288 RepID=UPI0039C6EFAA